MPVAPGPLGWIDPKDRTKKQTAAHAMAMAAMPAFAIQYTEPTGPVKVVLTDFWKRPEVVADVGLEFNGFYQFTGSCVGVGGGNAIFTVAAIQRCIADDPTMAFIPWWPWAYGTTRYDEGDRGQGQGAVVSVMGQVLHRKGIFAADQDGLPKFTRADGMRLTQSIEMQWSDGGRIDKKWNDVAAPHTVGTMAPLANTNDIKACIINGYPVLNGCAKFVGSGRIVGTGDNSYVSGKYDGTGGHCTNFLGYWDHQDAGPLFLYSNQWPSSTYPTDPAGAGRCCVWLPEVEVAKLFKMGGGGGETMGLSHLNYFKPQPKVLDWFIAP